MPPDSFPIDVTELPRRLAVLDSIDDLATQQAWPEVIPPAVLNTGRSSQDKLLYAVPLNVERDNTLFYNKDLFSATSVPPPTTMADFFAAAEALKQQGIPATPSLHAGWIVAMQLFEDVLVSEAGPQFYVDYFNGRSVGDAPEIRQALSDLSGTFDYASSDSLQDWRSAFQDVCDGRAAMLFLPDFVDRYGCTNPANVGYVPLQPPGAPTFVFAAGPSYVLPSKALHRDTAIEFLKAVGSKEGQEAFSALAGAIPARVDAAPSGLDAIAQKTLADFRAPNEALVLDVGQLAPPPFLGAVNPALQEFADPASAKYRDINAVLEVLKTTYTLTWPQ
jgi:glucose/mannose transport system substrate-binding protein